MSRYFLILTLFFVPLLVFSQVRVPNHTIHISNAPLIIQNDLSNNWKRIKSDPSVWYDNAMYALIQFNDIPSDDEKAVLSNLGIDLLNYIPNYAWVSSIDSNIELDDLLLLDVRHVTKVLPDWKVSDEIISGTIPEYAGSSENLKVKVLFWNYGKEIDVSGIVGVFGSKVNSVDTEKGWASIECPLELISIIAEHPTVQYIEFISPPISGDGILDESERTISTYISENPGKGFYFDGTGVKIGVEEGGIVDPAQNPNFRSRINRSNETSTNISGHKTGVALRMGSAGNINPKDRGTAFGAEVYSGGFDFANAALDQVTIINRSVGWGCPSGSETYNSSSQNYDNLVRTYPSFMITHSAGNIGGSNCYVGTAGWGNITGLPKMAKNIFVVGSSGNDGTLAGFSSRGPAKDGRILPNVVAPGAGGTSHASPNLAGVYGQLNHAYRFHNGGTIPNSGLLKAIILNTADDMLNPGPDFKTGFGHVNARRAYEVIRQSQFSSSFVSQGGSNTHLISVPQNLKVLKVMVYWVDWEATPGIVSRALVNDLDVILNDPNAVNYQPWVLNPNFNAATLDDYAVRATDSLNNVEQITLKNPVGGNYLLSVTGTMVPQGPQEYFINYEFVDDNIIVTHPHGGEKWVPNETERIRWDACDSNLTFDLSFSSDNGATWSTIASQINADDRYYDWTVPELFTDQAKIKLERGTIGGVSDTTFTILAQPSGLDLVWSCSDSSLLIWDELQNADGYILYRIVGDYMDSVGYTTANAFIFNGLSLTESEFLTIAAVQNGIVSRRSIAIERLPNDLNCNYNDAGTLQLVSPGVDNIPSCMAGITENIEVLVRNLGVNTIDSIPIALRVNGGLIYYETIYSAIPSGADYSHVFSASPYLGLGTNFVQVWTALNGDMFPVNDTIGRTITVYPASSSSVTLTQEFDNFTNCSTSWDCELVNCSLQDGWYNVPNSAGDDIDWRTDNNGTGTSMTGPSGDHTSGTGKYLYLEGSGNGGSGCVNSTALLYSPCLDMAGVNQAELSFWYHAYGSSIGELHVDAIADGELYEDIMIPIIGAQGDQWINQIVDLSQFTGRKLVVVFRGSTGSGYQSDLALDDIEIRTSPLANFFSTNTELCISDVIMVNNFTVYGDSYEWSIQPNTVTFQNGTNINSTNPQLSFDSSGDYSIQLIATNTIGTDTLLYTDYIHVWEEVPSLSPTSAFCEYDSVLIFSNNAQTVDYYLNGSIVNSSNAPSYNYQNISEGDTIHVTYHLNSGCTLNSDSIILEFVDVEVGVIQTDIQLSAISSGVSYQWIDCENNNAVIPGETDQIFIPVLDGEYAVEVTENGCKDTSACFVFDLNSLSEYEWESFKLYPNPTSGALTIDFGKVQSGVNVTVHSLIGQVVEVLNFENQSKVQFELKGAPAVYLVEVRSENVSRTVRVVQNNGGI
ncbi:S8 family serine peptidase [Crocinitomicaceae bacterium]|nr:S8 family serine peptidase [Crocinitomicaceae bacterium]